MWSSLYTTQPLCCWSFWLSNGHLIRTSSSRSFSGRSYIGTESSVCNTYNTNVNSDHRTYFCWKLAGKRGSYQEEREAEGYRPISKVYWSEKDTAVLLEIYGSHKYQKMFLGGKVSYKVIWTEIAREVIKRTGLAGIDYKTCWDKQKYLKKKYKEAKKSVTSGFGGEVTLSCPHFDEMDKLFSEELRIQLLLLSLRLLSWKRRRRSSTLQQFQQRRKRSRLCKLTSLRYQ